MVNCLASAVPIVTPEYFRDFVAALTSRYTLHAARCTPHSAPLQTAAAPDLFLHPARGRDWLRDTAQGPRHHLRVSSSSSSSSSLSLSSPRTSYSSVSLERSRVFHGLTLVFLTDSQLQANATPVRLAGGKTKLWSGGAVSELSLPGVVVIQPPVAVRSSQSQAAADWTLAAAHLSAAGLTPAGQTHIYLAIAHGNTRTYCNPSKRASNVLPSRAGPVVGVGGGVVVAETLSPAPGLSKTRASKGDRPPSRRPMASPWMGESRDCRLGGARTARRATTRAKAGDATADGHSAISAVSADVAAARQTTSAAFEKAWLTLGAAQHEISSLNTYF